MTLVIQNQCIDIKDGICTTSCPVDCIYEGERMYYIHPTECIECGMCETICPVDAIRYDDEMDAENAVFAKINREVFLDASGALTEPGGWYKGDAPVPDHPRLADYARREPAAEDN